MDIQLVIPTHGRPAKQVTLMQVPESMRDKVLVVTSTHADAQQIVDNYDHVNIVVAKGVKSIAEKRHWIMNNVKAKFIFMMDDDMTFFARCDLKHRAYGDGWKLRKTAPAGVYLLNKATDGDWNKFVADLHRMPAVAVGMSSRMGNDRQEAMWAANTRLMHAFGVNVATYKKLKLSFAEVKVREDMNVALRLLRAGYSNTVYFDMCCSPGSYNAPGGASTERTLEQSNKEAVHLAALHPGLVKVVQKHYATSLPRKEVVVQWKRAYAEGVANA